MMPEEKRTVKMPHNVILEDRKKLSVTGVELLLDAVRLAEQAAARNGWQDRLIFRRGDLRRSAACCRRWL